MTTFLTVLGIVLGYLVTGAIYARSQAARLYAKAKKEWKYESLIRESVTMSLFWRVPFWPWAMVFDFIAGPLRTWFMAPISDRKERAEKLREDARWQAEFAREQTDPEVRRVLKEYAADLRRQAEEVDL